MTVSPGGRKLGRIRLADAHRHIRDRVARGIGSAQTLRCVVMLQARPTNDVPSGTLKPYYEEDMGDTNHVGTLKRIVKGEFRKWDQNLSFAELRAGRFVSEKTVIERIEARAFKRTAA